jgi:hypothetical protein
MSRLGFSNPSPPVPLTPGASTYLDAATLTSYSGTGSNINDLTANGNNGTIIGGVTYTNVAGGSWLLDGRSGFIRVGPVLGSGSATESYSMSIWVAPLTQFGNLINMAQDEPPGGWRTPPMICDQQTFRARVWSNNFLQSSVYTIGTWYYVTTVFDYTNGQQRFYVNGSLVSSQSSITYSSSGLANFLRLGGNAGGGNGNAGWFRGYIGAFHHYRNKALTDAEVLFNYNATSSRFVSAAGSPIVSTNLGLYLDTNRIGSATGTTTWTDFSGNSLNMTGPTATQLTVRPLGADTGFQNKGLISAGGLISNGGTGGGVWSTAGTSLLNNDTHTVSMWIKFNSSTTFPNGWSGNWEKFFGQNAPGTDRTPGVWRWPTYRYIHWRYDPGNTGADFGRNHVSGSFAEDPAQSNFVLDTWYHITQIKNGGTATRYVNGVNIGSTAALANPKTASAGNSINLFEGYAQSSAQIDGLMVYNRVLSDAEVLQNYNALRGPYWQNPTADRLIFEIDANNPASYPGTGTAVYETSGRQLTGSTTNVTYDSTATNGTGGASGAWTFNGSTSFISFPYDSIHDVAGNGVTAEVWVKPANFTQNGFFIEKGQVNSQYSLFMSGNILFWRTITSVNGQTDLTVAPLTYMNTTEWHHVVGTYISGNKKLYINGVLVGTQTNITGTINNNGNGIWLGKHALPDSYFYNGQIGEARIYNRQLSDADVLSNYNNTKGRYAKASLPVKAVSGGTLSSDATYYYRTFTATGNLEVNGGTIVADALVIGGGGAGGPYVGGGGGSGGFVEANTMTLIPGTYTATIGAGGDAGGTPRTDTWVNGSNSSVVGTNVNIVAAGGGKGGRYASENGFAGGSGGGAGGAQGLGGVGGATTGSSVSGSAIPTSSIYGFKGGNNTTSRPNNDTEGRGGGGAGGAGVDGPTENSSNGGAGRQSSYSGTSLYYAAGGGGGGFYPADAGVDGKGGNGGIGGGGGGGVYANGTVGTGGGSAVNSGSNGSSVGEGPGGSAGQNTGSGGGGCGHSDRGGSGGSGIVVFRYTRAQVGG